MEHEQRLGKPQESFWRSIVSDLQNTGLLRGNSVPNLDHPAIFNAQLYVPLATENLNSSVAGKETVLRAAWALVMARHTSSADVIFFSSFNEKKPWLAPIRLSVPAHQPVSEWLVELEAWLKIAEENGPAPDHFMALAKEEGLARSLATFLIIPPGARAFPPRHQIKGPLMVVVRLDISRVEFHYDSGWFDPGEIQALGDHLNIVLQEMATSPQATVGNLPVLTTKEKNLLLNEWNNTSTPFAEKTCIHEFFEAQVERTPDAVAVIFCNRLWTYRELNAEAEIVAGKLKKAGVGPGTFVAICINRSLELMATLLAVFKSGGAYVPLDPAYPIERLAFMIEDAKPAVIVVSRQTASLFPQAGPRLLRIDENSTQPIPKTTPDDRHPSQTSDPAYVLYTSGSTGKPKGVVVTHRNVSNFFTAMDAVIGTETGVWLAVTSINFDISRF